MLYARSGSRRPITGGNDHYTKLLVPSDGASGTIDFADKSVGGNYGHRHTLTRSGDVVMSNAVGLQGRTTALYIDGSGDSIDAVNHKDFDLADHDFTLDFAYRCTAIPGSGQGGRGVIGNYDAATKSGWYIWQDNVNGSQGAGSLYFYLGRTSAYDAVWTSGIPINTTKHLAVVRSRSRLIFFVDGVNVREIAVAADLKYASPVRDLQIGRVTYGEASTAVGSMTGYLGEVRLSIGIARWTANFTPPITYWKAWE